MKNNAIIVALLAGGALFAGCSGNEPTPPSVQDVRFSVSLSEFDGTRGAANEGGLSNMEGRELTFTIAVVSGSGDDAVAVYAASQKATVSGGTVAPVDFTTRLVPGENYTLVAYANFNGTNGLSLAEDATEADYLAALRDIHCSYEVNNEASDSYFAVYPFVSGQETVGVSLTRPCAKVTVINTGNALPENTTVTAELSGAYSLTNIFNALTGSYTSTDLTTSTVSSTGLPTGYDAGDQTVMTLYVPVNADGTVTGELKLTVNNGSATIEKTISVPMKRNTLTMVSGDFNS